MRKKKAKGRRSRKSKIVSSPKRLFAPPSRPRTAAQFREVIDIPLWRGALVTYDLVPVERVNTLLNAFEWAIQELESLVSIESRAHCD